MSKYDLYRNTICKEDDNDYILLFKDEESAKNVYDEFNQKDQRIAELEEEIENLQEDNDEYRSRAFQCEDDNIIVNELLELLDLPADENLIVDKVKRLNKELAELKENAIVPKFNFGDTIFAVVTYIDDPEDKTVIESGIVQKIECDKNQIKYWCDNGRIYWEDKCEKLFATKAEAEKALKEQK